MSQIQTIILIIIISIINYDLCYLLSVSNHKSSLYNWKLNQDV